ncbi:HNH endonuclease signature motif containing protein [Brevibacterium metallidurans]
MDETTTTTGRAAADEAVEKPPDPYQPVSSVSPVSERSGQAPLESDPDWVKELARNSPGVPVLNPFDPRPVADSADRTESNGGLNALTGNEIVAAIQRNIACVAHCHARIIALIDEVERRELWAQWIGVKSLAGWVMHIAAVSAHTAREYVRVMHALREMPLVKANLSAGDLSFSKVREVTRLVGRIPDEDALRLAKLGTGAQVSVVSRNYRKLSAAEENGELPQLLPRDDVLVCSAGPGRSRIVVDLPEDDAAEFVTMLSTARQVIERREDENGEDGCAASTVPSEPVDVDPWTGCASGTDSQPAGSGQPRRGERISQVMCLMEVIRAFPRAQSSGAVDLDRARMLVHTSAEVLLGCADAFLPVVLGDAENVPAGTHSEGDVPAGTSEATAENSGDAEPGTSASPARRDETCRIDGFGGITAATAQRLACESLVSGIIKDEAGNVLKLGRSRRLASRRQKMALSARDVSCQFPGCLSRRRCEAHHIRPWSRGGVTDLDNLVLLCRSHHISVHEHDLTIVRTAASFSGALEGAPAFAFFLPDGSELFACDSEHPGRRVFDTAKLVRVVEKATAKADPSTLGGGYGFDLGNCVAWMFEAEARHARARNVAA